MTDLTGPFRIRALDSDTTAAKVSAGGTAQFTGIDVSGNVKLDSGSAAFRAFPGDQTLKAGTSSGDLWPLVQVAQATLSAGSKAPVNVPVGADILGFRVHTTRTPGSAADHTIRVGTSTDSDLYGTITYTGALSKPLGNADITVSAGAGNNWQAITNTPIIPDVTASGSADANWTGIIYVDYKMP